MTENPLLIKTLADVQARAAVHTGAILYEAFRRTHVSCPDCNYIENAEEYDYLLPFYIRAKKDQTHYQKKIDGRWYGRAMSVNSRLDIASLNLAESNIAYYKALLKSITPCPSCRKRFNPTGRIKWPEPTTPEIKEFFDE